MTFNNLNYIAKIYSEQILESAVPGKPAERLGAITAIPKSEQDAARERILAKTKAKREAMKSGEKDPFGRPGGKYGGVKKGGGYDKGYEAMQKKLKELDKVKTEALDPVGQEDADIDNDGDTDKSDKYLHNRRKAIGKAIVKNRGKNVKEGFSNWRQDLSEVMDDDVDNKPVKEKKVNNKVKTSAMGGGLKLGEAVEQIGGILLEMVEISEEYLSEAIDISTEYFYGQGLNEHGVQILIDEMGEDSFCEWVFDIVNQNILVERKLRSGETALPAKSRERITKKSVSRKNVSDLKGGAAAAKERSDKARGESRAAARQTPEPTERQKTLARLQDAQRKRNMEKAKSNQTPTKSKSTKTKSGIASRIGSALKYVGDRAREDSKKVARAAGTTAGVVHGAGIVAHRLGKEAGKSKTGQAIKKKLGISEEAESEQQQKLFGLALSVKRGQTPRSEVSDAVLKIVDSMSEKKIRDFAKTKHEGIPKKVEEDLQPTTPQQFAAQKQLAMVQKKLTAADQIALQKKKKDVQQAQEEFVSEEDYDTMKDRHLERGGMGARSSTSLARKSTTKPQTDAERKSSMEKQRETARKALELVRQKYKGSLM